MINSILIMGAILAVVVMSILNNSFKNGHFTCDKYILNTYLYLILAIIFVALVQTLTYKKVNIFSEMIEKYRMMYIIGLFILLIISILGISLTDPKHIVQKHFFWLMFVSFCAILFQPIHMMYVKV